jgi:hypothetical protein
VIQLGCVVGAAGDSVGHVVAQLRMLWLNFRCVGTTVGDVVAQKVLLSIENVVPY